MIPKRWHLLDTGSIWLREFAWEFGQLTEAENWCPETRTFGHWQKWEESERLSDPAIRIIRFPLQRCYARYPVTKLLPFQHVLLNRLKARSGDAGPERAGLVCTAPFYAPLAELWPGPVVYYLTDLTKKYQGINETRVVELDRRMCRVAAAVCPNSKRIADYLCGEAGCDRAKVAVIPNATRVRNIPVRPLTAAQAAPDSLKHLPRPIVGVIGNLAGNMDWELLSSAIRRTPDVSWAFVGPTAATISNRVQSNLRAELMKQGGRVAFVGHRPYSELASYARAFDAALLPYLKIEPTYSGSATRFYEHLAAGRPILATRGFHELLSKEPLLKLIDTGEELAGAIETLRANGFKDGFEEERWIASQTGTWRQRAKDLIRAADRALVQ